MKNKNNLKLALILVLAFIITELIDITLDTILGNSLLHSVLQLVLFMTLFLIIYTAFTNHTSKKIKRLIPEELMMMLKIIKNEKSKNKLINQRKLREILKITKPTIKKRVDTLINLNYLTIEKKGNNSYLILTSLGESITG